MPLDLAAILILFPSQNQQNVKVLVVCLIPHDQKWKKLIWTEKKCSERLAYLHIGFWVCWLQCTIRALCDKYFLSSDGFFPWFLTGKSRYRVQKHGVRMGSKEDCCIGPIPFWSILCYSKFWFFWKCRENLHHWLPQTSKYVPLKPFQCIPKSIKCKIFSCLLNTKMKKTSICTMIKCWERLENLHI